jgi:phosphatidylglycerophosphatase A
MDRLAKLLATFFYTGLSPVAPGTVGSFFGLLLYVGVSASLGLTLVVFLALLVIGFFSAGRAEKIFGKKDSQNIVIDEVCGIFLAFFNVPLAWPYLAAGFLLFRVLDIAKPFPVRRLEKLPGSFGVMADDLMCGLCTNLILRILFIFHLLKV